MERYSDTDGDSGVVAFGIEREAITVHFEDGSLYRYSYARAGRDCVEAMKRLALAGDGLNSFINRYAKKRSSERSR